MILIWLLKNLPDAIHIKNKVRICFNDIFVKKSIEGDGIKFFFKRSNNISSNHTLYNIFKMFDVHTMIYLDKDKFSTYVIYLASASVLIKLCDNNMGRFCVHLVS